MKICKKCGREIYKNSCGWHHQLTEKEMDEVYEAQEAGARLDEEGFFGHKPKVPFWKLW